MVAAGRRGKVLNGIGLVKTHDASPAVTRRERLLKVSTIRVSGWVKDSTRVSPRSSFCLGRFAEMNCMKSIKCQSCGLVNFAEAEKCKRCAKPLTAALFANSKTAFDSELQSPADHTTKNAGSETSSSSKTLLRVLPIVSFSACRFSWDQKIECSGQNQRSAVRLIRFNCWCLLGVRLA